MVQEIVCIIFGGLLILTGIVSFSIGIRKGKDGWRLMFLGLFPMALGVYLALASTGKKTKIELGTQGLLLDSSIRNGDPYEEYRRRLKKTIPSDSPEMELLHSHPEKAKRRFAEFLTERRIAGNEEEASMVAASLELTTGTISKEAYEQLRKRDPRRAQE